jgi:hypothetical protein
MVTIDGNRAKEEVSKDVVNMIKTTKTDRLIDIIIEQENQLNRKIKENTGGSARVDWTGIVTPTLSDEVGASTSEVIDAFSGMIDDFDEDTSDSS